MSGTTYSRSSGRRILARTYKRLRAQHPDLPFEDLADIASAFGAAPDGAPSLNDWVKQVELVPYLRFSRQLDARALIDPAAIGAIAIDPSQPVPHANHDPYVLPQPAMPEATALDLLRQQGALSRDDLLRGLETFSGPVEIRQLPVGTELYRIVGLLSQPDRVARGDFINKLLGEFWMLLPPSRFSSVAEWRASMAVRVDWNGDHGFVRIRLAQGCWAAVGAARSQTAHPQPRLVHAGGGQQVFLPGLTDKHLITPIGSRPLNEVIEPTEWTQ